jgi:hypothetical protein
VQDEKENNLKTKLCEMKKILCNVIPIANIVLYGIYLYTIVNNAREMLICYISPIGKRVEERAIS